MPEKQKEGGISHSEDICLNKLSSDGLSSAKRFANLYFSGSTNNARISLGFRRNEGTFDDLRPPLKWGERKMRRQSSKSPLLNLSLIRNSTETPVAQASSHQTTDACTIHRQKARPRKM